MQSQRFATALAAGTDKNVDRDSSESSQHSYTVVATAMNVHVGMYTCAPRPIIGWVGLYISGVDFGCFSTVYGDCEALDEREEQVDFTLFVCILAKIKKKDLDYDI